jgi:nitrous oxide reductase accessory protein NosL
MQVERAAGWGSVLRAWGRVWVLALGVLAACGSESTAQTASSRCDLCGMRLDPSSGWRSGGRAQSGAEVRFDSPKCLFSYHHREGGVRDPWFIEYYSQERRAGRDLFFVLGSDVQGSMGRDLVPVQGREAAERFSREHHGARVIPFDDVSAAIVEDLFRPQPRR